MLLQDISSSFLSHSSDTSNEPEFLKKYFQPNSQTLKQSRDLDLSQVTKFTHDIIGKPLEAFYRTLDADGKMMTVPHVFSVIFDYFMEDQTRLTNP